MNLGKPLEGMKMNLAAVLTVCTTFYASLNGYYHWQPPPVQDAIVVFVGGIAGALGIAGLAGKLEKQKEAVHENTAVTARLADNVAAGTAVATVAAVAAAGAAGKAQDAAADAATAVARKEEDCEPA